jgi:hypothetical protein
MLDITEQNVAFMVQWVAGLGRHVALHHAVRPDMLVGRHILRLWIDGLKLLFAAN